MMRISPGIAILVAIVGFAAPVQSAAPVTGVEADREEVSFNKTFKRAPIADEYLKFIVERITAAAQRPSTVEIRAIAVRADWPFVFALGNGATYVSTGLLARLSNDSQVATLIAPELASVLAPNTQIQAAYDQKNRRNSVGKILAVMATAGIAAFPISSAEGKAYNELQEAIVLDNDKTALRWVRDAGFDVNQGVVATNRLKELLAQEQLSGSNRLANAAGLEHRAAQLTRAAQQLPVDLTTKPPVPDNAEPFKSLSHKLSLDLVRLDFDRSQREGIVPMLDRIEREYGVSADTTCLRARYQRELPASSQVTKEVIAAHEACVAAPGAPVDNLKELAFLQRDNGDAAAAARNFEKYLSLAPQAVDAPIIRGYIEELRAHH